MKIPLAYGASRRDVGRMPQFVTRNMFVESSSANQESGLVLIGRAGLDPLAVLPTRAIRGVFQAPGLFGGDVLVVSGSVVYRVSAAAAVTTLTGTVPGEDRVRIAAGPDADGVSEARIATGEGLYVVKAGQVTREAFPDDAGVADVLFLRGFWIAIRAGSQQLYSRVPGDTEWDAITFTSAEYQPDKAVALSSIGDAILVFGEASMEPFALTGNAVNPIEPYGGSAVDVGCRARDTVFSMGGAVYAVGSDCAVYKFTPQEKVLSDNGLAEQIRKTDPRDLRMWGFELDQHAHVLLTLSDASYVYDDATQGWAAWNSKGYGFFRGHLGAGSGGLVVAGDALEGRLWRLNPETRTDAGEEIERIVTGFLEIKGGQVPCNNVTLNCAVGVGSQTGQGAAPKIGMRFSDDDAQTWSEWIWRELGAAGKYQTEVRWNGLPTIRKPPGRHFQFKVTDPVIVRISDARMNEA